MNWNDPQRDALDDLLRGLRGPSRMRSRSNDSNKSGAASCGNETNRRVLTASLAMAALVLLAVFVGSQFINRSYESTDIPIAKQMLTPPPIDSPAVAIVEATPTIAQEPDAFEQAIAMVYRRPTETPSIAIKQEAQPQLQQELPVEDVVDAAEVEEKFAAMYSPRITARLTAAERLGSLNNPIVSKRLVQMVLEGQVRRESLIALLHSSDPVARDFLARDQNDLALGPSLRAIHVQPVDLDSTN